MTVMDYRRLNAMKNAQKTPFQMILVTLFGFLPFILGIYALGHLGSWSTRTQEVKVRNYIADAVPFFFLFMIIEYFVLMVKGKQSYRVNDSINSISMGVFQQMIGILWKSLAVFPYTFIRQHFKVWDFDENEDLPWTSPVWWGMFFMAEFGYYWFHRLSHEWNSLWAGHVVHHTSEEYNLSTALRQGSMSGAFSWVFYLLGAPFFPIRLYLIHTQFNTLYQFWIHTGAIDKLPWYIEYIFNTPSHHRVHHGRNLRYLDKNFGGTLIIFDRMFGTFQAEEEEVKFGITHYLGTWNPFFLQFHHWAEMWTTCKGSHGIMNKIRVFIDRGPGYNCDLLYGDTDFDARDRIPKYDARPPNAVMTCYVCLQFVMAVAAATVILDSPKMMARYQIIGISWVFLGLYSISALMEQKSWAGNTEIFRYVITILGVLYFFPHLSKMYLMAVFGITITSITTLLYFYRIPIIKKID